MNNDSLYCHWKSGKACYRRICVFFPKKKHWMECGLPPAANSPIRIPGFLRQFSNQLDWMFLHIEIWDTDHPDTEPLFEVEEGCKNSLCYGGRLCLCILEGVLSHWICLSWSAARALPLKASIEVTSHAGLSTRLLQEKASLESKALFSEHVPYLIKETHDWGSRLSLEEQGSCLLRVRVGLSLCTLLIRCPSCNSFWCVLTIIISTVSPNIFVISLLKLSVLWIPDGIFFHWQNERMRLLLYKTFHLDIEFHVTYINTCVLYFA